MTHNWENMSILMLELEKKYPCWRLLLPSNGLPKKVPHKIIERRAGDIEQIYADTSNAINISSCKWEYSLIKTLLSA